MTSSTDSVEKFIPCTSYREPPPDSSADADCLLSNRMQDATGPEYLAVERSTFWPNGTVLRVLLLDSWVVRKDGEPDRIGTGVITTKVKTAVKKYVKLWEDHCSIRFQFVDERPADIRVGFGEDGHWSFVGTESTPRPVDERTMNLEFNDATLEKTLRGTTLHEFGHALGCIHEHQSPASPIQWNEAVVIDEVTKSQGWTKAMVYNNVLKTNTAPATAAKYKYTTFDHHSIMLYSFPAFWTLNNIGTNANDDLSQYDKYLIAEIYPPDVSHSNRFVTSRINHSGPHRLKNPTSVLLSNHDHHSPSPKIAVGLTSLNVEVGSNIRVRANADEPERSNMIIHLDSWFDTKLEAAGCTWLETPHSSCLQVGIFNTMECRSWTRPAPEASKDMKFATDFTKEPTVVVWLNWIDTDRNYDTRIKAYASDITLTGFKIHVDTSGDCVLYSGGVSWIAYPTGSPGICSGIITTTRDANDPHYEQTGTITFPENEFEGPPKGLIAVTSIDFAQGHDVNFDVLVDTVETTKLDWRIKSSIQSMCRGLDATYIAY